LHRTQNAKKINWGQININLIYFEKSINWGQIKIGLKITTKYQISAQIQGFLKGLPAFCGRI
jgi:hypothetical protein